MKDMNIKQIRSDFDTGVIIGRETLAELLAFAEQADAVIAGRQQAIGALNMRIAELEQRGVNVPQVRSNPAAHDWAAQVRCETIDSNEFAMLEGTYISLAIDASSPTSFDMYNVRMAGARAALIAHIDARISATDMADRLALIAACRKEFIASARAFGEKAFADYFETWHTQDRIATAIEMSAAEGAEKS